MVSDVQAMRRALRRAGFRRVAREWERDIVLDNESAVLRQSRRLLRLRRHGRRWKLTLKGAPHADARYKSRPETETEIGDGQCLLRILAELGYQPAFRYEKKRSSYRQQDRGPIASLDVTPIGTFLELEGPRAWIDRTARALGYSPGDYITKSYGLLYQEYCEARGQKPSNMVFGA